MQGRLISITGLLAIVSLSASAAVAPLPSTSDLWDVSNGTSITATSGALTPDARTLIGLPLNVGGELNDAYFPGGKPQGFTHFIEFQTLNPVTIRSFSLYAGDDRSSGNALRRAFSNFALYGWNGSSYTQLFNQPVTLPYVNQQAVVGALVFWEDIPEFTSNKWRAEFTQPAAYQGTLYGPRVIELDGYANAINPPPPPSSVPLPAAALMAIPGAALVGYIRRRWR